MNFPSSDYTIKFPLPQSNLVLAMGIVSLVSSLLCCISIGIVFAIIALVLARQDKRLYNMNPEKYTLESYNQLKAGVILSWITVALNLLGYFIFLIIVVTGNLYKFK